jgi:hypothetical protein
MFMKKLSCLKRVERIGIPMSSYEKGKSWRESQIRQVFQTKLKSMAKTLDLDTENEYNMSYIVIDRLSIEGLI